MITLSDLQQLTALSRQREEAAASALAQQARDAEAGIAAIDQALSRTFAAEPTAWARHMLNADRLWHDRLTRQRADAFATLAELRARQDMQREILSRAIGQDEALTLLLRDERKRSGARRTARRDSEVQALCVTLHNNSGTRRPK